MIDFSRHPLDFSQKGLPLLTDLCADSERKKRRFVTLYYEPPLWQLL